MIVNMLRNLNNKYSSHYRIIKCINFEPIHYAIDDAFFNRNWAGVCLGSLGRTRIDAGQVQQAERRRAWGANAAALIGGL